ncbi:unnamed protein product [Schistosoma turkestanicum]|nr:unnamed protein product [Schistosoma turkestanicum]
MLTNNCKLVRIRYHHVILLLLLLLLTFINHVNSSNQEEIVVAKWKFNEFEIHITVMLFLLAVVFIKIAYHYIPYVSSYVPESFILILIGIVFGAIVRYGIDQGSTKITSWKFTPEIFFNYLLPPIILESAYGLYNRTFSEYLGTVMLFAVLGTIFNFLIIGFVMYGLFIGGAFGYPEITVDLSSFLLFSSLIVAIDPVAVLAIFQDIGLELNLYYIVFGESLLNDAITVVLYEIMIAFTGKENITGEQIGIGIASFFTVSFGGLLIGVVFGVLTCLITRIRSHLAIFTMLSLAYFSYIMANCIGWSGIISMIACGLIQTAYAFHNVDAQTRITVHNFVRVVAEISESVIFLFLGIAVIGETLKWHTGYILWAMVICLIARGIVVLLMTSIVNIINVDDIKITLTEQTVLIYGGLRGAVAFSLAILIPPEILGKNGEENQSLIVTTTLFIILFTVGVMGITIKPLVKVLKIRMEDKKKLSLFKALNDNVLDEMLSGIEVIINCKRRNVIRDFIKRIDEKYIRRILQRNPEHYNEKLFKIYEKISLRLHYAAMRPNQSKCLLTDLPESITYKYLTNNLLTGQNNIIHVNHTTYDNNNNNNNNNNNEPLRTSHSSAIEIFNNASIDFNATNNNVNNHNQQRKCFKKRKPFFKIHKSNDTIDEQMEQGDIINQSINNDNHHHHHHHQQQTMTSNNPSPNTTTTLRHHRRQPILPNISEQQTDFNDQFLNILKSRNYELMSKLTKPSLPKLSAVPTPATLETFTSGTLPHSSSVIPRNNASSSNVKMSEEKDDQEHGQQPSRQSEYPIQTIIQDKRHKTHFT